MPKFSVTYEIYESHEPEEDVCEADDRGFVCEDVSLREAIEETGGRRAAWEANESPLHRPRWFTNYEYNENYLTGEREVRSFHVPDSVTPASRLRIARYLGIRT